MKQIQTIIFLLLFFCLLTCKAQKKDDGKTLNITYNVGSITEINDFLKYNPDEIRFDSIYLAYDNVMDSIKHADSNNKDNELIRKKDFRNNRSRIFMDLYNNGKAEPKDEEFNTGLPTPCECFTDKDTLFIRMGIGFFGGFGFNIEAFGKNFKSSFFNYIDDVKPYKTDLSDTSFYNFITIKNKYQYLILDKKPKFDAGQQLTGYLTYTTNDYYEQNYSNKFDTMFVTGKLFFTCKIRQRTEWDR